MRWIKAAFLIGALAALSACTPVALAGSAAVGTAHVAADVVDVIL